jgi:hypothetical protein
MPLSNKLRADYVELINGELDRIQIQHDKEFDLVIQELQKIIEPPGFFLALKGFFSSSPTPLLSEEIKGQLDYIRYLFNTPRDFVTLPADYAEYRQILTERIAAKIDELKTFKPADKERYIQFQKEIHLPPGHKKE